jgi:hypothetical protein
MLIVLEQENCMRMYTVGQGKAKAYLVNCVDIYFYICAGFFVYSLQFSEQRLCNDSGIVQKKIHFIFNIFIKQNYTQLKR